LINNAPANVDPIIRNFGFDLKFFDLKGKVPTNDTIIKKNIINKTFSKAVIVVYYIKIKI
jgi:hypothetical protein